MCIPASGRIHTNTLFFIPVTVKNDNMQFIRPNDNCNVPVLLTNGGIKDILVIKPRKNKHHNRHKTDDTKDNYQILFQICAGIFPIITPELILLFFR